ncbi:MAG: energy transducer TonB [Paludibacteraceae bacterium]|jgi:protein TonB|nr:energy transducer TonB [Paludibacteraceae bacterium]
MEVKKNASASLENKSHDFLLMGLVVALGFLFIVFEWSTVDVKKTAPIMTDEYFVTEDLVPVTIQKPNLPPPALAAPPRVIAPVIKPVENNVDVDPVEVVPTDEPITYEPVVTEPEVIDEDIIHVRAEIQPSFPGGPDAMMKFLKENLKFPSICAENGIQGRVVVSFVVNKNGSIEQVEVLSGVHERLDAEAVRVVKLMPTWTPGQMQGHAVRTKFILPVTFRMAN